MENTLDMLKSYLFSLFTTLKNSFISAASVFTAFVAPIGDLLFFVCFLILIDFITGVTAAKYKGEIRTSGKMIKSAYKMFFYTSLLMVMHSFDHFVEMNFKPNLLNVIVGDEGVETVNQFKFLAALAFLLIVRELKSIDENWNFIFGWSFINHATVIYDKVINIITLIKSKK